MDIATVVNESYTFCQKEMTKLQNTVGNVTETEIFASEAKAELYKIV